MEAPLVSIVIVCMNRLDNLYPCLEGLQAHTTVPCECFVVAYRFSPENLARAQADFPWVRWVVSDEVRGFSENNNLALRQARGRYCFVVNDDTEMHEDVIGALLRDLDRLPPDAAIVSPRLLNADGSLQLCGRPPYLARFYVLQQWHLHREPIDDTVGKTPLFGEVFRSSNITGAAFLIRTEVFRELGWFDETYFFTPEDIALSTLARKKGYGVYVDRAVTIVHKWRTTATRMSPAIRPAAVRGSLLFFSGGSRVKYFLLALPVWLAESSKRAKAALRLRRDPSEANRIAWETFRNISHSIFTRETPKQLFLRYYHG
ncbi:MAG: glycosyltransferase [Bacteroidales bacterium]|nr:glycosyltransferase [Bacteroidales bacterium]